MRLARGSQPKIRREKPPTSQLSRRLAHLSLVESRAGAVTSILVPQRDEADSSRRTLISQHLRATKEILRDEFFDAKWPNR